ncbi:MAG: replicative DNA helicase [Myxococcales bacterium]|nr:replicative DNA helicase [Myxococcales bacterium]MCB9709509.1 replicative DNA helicase [Myxococcales bacterium]
MELESFSRSVRGPQTQASQRVPPYSLEAERSVLGGILLENSAIHGVVEHIAAEDFYSEAHVRIFQSMLDLFAHGQPVDTITVREELGKHGNLQAAGGDEYLLELTNTIPTVTNIESHAKIIREKSVVRRLIAACHEIAAGGYGDYGEFEAFLDQSEKAVFGVVKERERNPTQHIAAVVKATFEEIDQAAKNKGHVIGLPTGFEKLDHLTAGLHPGDLVIVAGRPGMGKTAFALNVGVNACIARKKTTAVFSLEMASEQLVRRMLCSEARVDGSRLRTGHLLREDWPKLVAAAGLVSGLPIWVDDTPALTMMELRGKSRRLMAEHDLGLIVVDYMQLMRSGSRNESREQEISEISRSLKALAKELRVPVVALSQLNRGVETRGTKDKRPQLSDLRESGAIEQDADTILFIYRDELYNRETPDVGIAEIIIGKQRSGPIGVVRCRFFSEYTRFENLADDDPGGSGSDPYGP